ncbi:hypothetical protein ACFSUS_04970 [Spirosoma soli]|uniref:Uncharacterized protein n=1 Tax=Spirosoma soli TaxID=1770529 RepID=A0ABW5M0A8_9BACT
MIADSAYRVDISSPYSKTPATTRLPVFGLDRSLNDQLVTRNLSIQVQNSYCNQYTAQPLSRQPDSAAFTVLPMSATCWMLVHVSRSWKKC